MHSHFYNPVATFFGHGALEKIVDLSSGKVALITFPEARPLGLIDRIQDMLKDRLTYILEDVQPNPDVQWLRLAYERFWKEAATCETVIAVGGGSAIDTAKALIVGTHSGKFDELLNAIESGQTFVPARTKALIAAPTTAGTGSEVTPWATIWDAEKQKKYSLHLDQTWPTFAVIDPDLMLTVPAAVTVSTGLDALSHALEAIWNVNANPLSDTFATSAIEDILECLPALVRDLTNKDLRARMALAALKSGMAFSNTKTALAHSISYEMTLRHGLSHGIACSFTLPRILGLAWGRDQSRDRTLQKIFGKDQTRAQARLEAFLQSLGVKTQFSDYGVSDADAESIIENSMHGSRGQNFISASVERKISTP